MKTTIAILLLALLVCVLFRKQLIKLFDASKKATTIELLSLTCFTVLGVLIVYRGFLFGHISYVYNDIGSDTIQQYLPYYIGIIDSIEDGTFSFWDASFGLGSSRYLSQSWFFDPFNILLIPLGLIFGQSVLPLLLVIIQIIRIFLCAFLFRWYISLFCKIPLIRIFGSVLFAFNGFMILWGEHYWFGNASLSVMLILIPVELLLRKRSIPHFVFLAAMVFLNTFVSVYLACMTFIFGTIYTVFRTLYISKSIKELFGILLPIVAAVLIGLVLSGFILVPTASLLLFDSTRITGTGKSAIGQIANATVTFLPVDQSILSLSRIFSSNCFVTGLEVPPFSNYYEIVQIGTSVGTLVLSLQFVFAMIVNKTTSQKNKVLIIVATILILSYFVTTFFPTLFNLGATASNRSSYCIIPVLIASMCLGLERVILPRKTSIITLLLSLVISLGILFFSYVHATEKAHLVCILLCLALLVFSGLLLAYQKSGNKGLFALALAVLVASVYFDSYVSTNLRQPFDSSQTPTSEEQSIDADTEAALEYLQLNDSGLYRIEKTYYDWTWYNDSLTQNYDGVAVYNGGMAGKLVDFYSFFWPKAKGVSTYYQTPRSDLNQPELFSILGVKYILSKDELTYTWCEEIARFGSVTIYKNKSFAGFGSLFNHVISQSSFEKDPSFDIQDTLEELLVVPDDIASDLSSSRDTSSAISPSFSDNLGNISLEKRDDGNYTGEIVANTNVEAMIPIPRDNGWHLYIDGSEVNTYDADYAFIGFRINEGTHSIELLYYPYGLRFGFVLSALGVLLLFISCFIISRTAAKKASTEDNLGME